jgi:hypothetical protein
MIHVRSSEGDLLRVLPAQNKTTVQFHNRYGFVTPQAFESRKWMRGYHGMTKIDETASFSFGIQTDSGRIAILDTHV